MSVLTLHTTPNIRTAHLPAAYRTKANKNLFIIARVEKKTKEWTATHLLSQSRLINEDLYLVKMMESNLKEAKISVTVITAESKERKCCHCKRLHVLQMPSRAAGNPAAANAYFHQGIIARPSSGGGSDTDLGNPQPEPVK